jgi:myo-inositol-1(or 4)-monophosphatase
VAGTKSSPVDIVTEVDHASERLIFDRLTAARPGDAFLGEEGGADAGSDAADGPTDDQVQWVVDPIDGTVNFVYGIPTYAVSIAAAVGGRSVAGVVLNAHTGERFTATLGGGAFHDGVRLELPGPGSGVPAKPLAQRLVGTGFNYEAHVKRLQAAAAALMLLEVRDLRRIGSAALDLCAVAAGRYDAYVEEGLNPWDAAAGGLVATEAGAELARWRGAGGKDCYVCAPAHEFEEFADLVRRCGFLAPED